MKLFYLLILLLSTATVYAQDDLAAIQKQWAICEYQVPAKQQSDCLEKLSVNADRISSQDHTRVDILIWSAIVKSSWAGSKGGLGALGLVKDAKQKLELALRLNPEALSGSAYTSLGALYYQVPGWPIRFGDDKRAEQLLKQALAINPDGIDANFFYGDFLLEQKRKDEARRYLNKALKAPVRPGRELADRGRRQEIEQRLLKLQ
ncbi:tetratricopeptide repeat protein [Acerihabitans sp. TG2]|uniref:tetratricopeptide repeat protein n=1 Tax=Acerihabitans sp. TG2 TaxID=3096008 RepID=UPI002B23566D|nr:tetratricopeptide repeat protein [Acerihabitans sp. TG2]MEA9393269.1 tetratricopeptide repeat protein [Acerihabitans sp. TG2]